MKKYILALVILLGITLTGCIPEEDNDPDPVGVTYTEEELLDLIESLIPEANVDTTYDMTSFQAALVDMIAEARDGVLYVEVETSEGVGTGSGVIYKREGNTYYLVTNEHVVEDAISIQLAFERYGQLLLIPSEDITLVGADPTTDLAVITFETEIDFTVIPFADSYDIEIGEFVFAIGNPLGFEYYGTVTMGVISGLTRYINEEPFGGTFNSTVFQHDAAISPGNSGGALININGELIGINNMKVVQENVSNIGFAIPSNTVKRIVEDLEDDGEIQRPYLGISANPYLNNCSEGWGVCVTVQAGGAADAAGLEDDDVIVGYKTEDMDDFIDIYNFNDLKEAILNSSVGETIQIKYVRDGIVYISTETQLGTHPDD